MVIYLSIPLLNVLGLFLVLEDKKREKEKRKQELRNRNAVFYLSFHQFISFMLGKDK